VFAGVCLFTELLCGRTRRSNSPRPSSPRPIQPRAPTPSTRSPLPNPQLNPRRCPYPLGSPTSSCGGGGGYAGSDDDRLDAVARRLDLVEASHGVEGAEGSLPSSGARGEPGVAEGCGLRRVASAPAGQMRQRAGGGAVCATVGAYLRGAGEKHPRAGAERERRLKEQR
jgi:hypothetical protein